MYNLNINKSSVVPTNLIVGRVLDKPFDTFQFKIFDGLDPFDLTGATLDFRGVTPDNKKVISTNVKITDAKSGEIEFQLPTNFYSAQGQFRNAYFRINKSGLTESTNDLLINVLNAVDLNLDDSQIIIDQLDKIIEDAINKLDKELANIKALLQKEKENIEQLKRDVASYKQTFDKQMADMQKQIDDLRGIINSTDVQRPQITNTEGGAYQTWVGDFKLLDKLKTLGKGFHTVRASGGNGELPSTGSVILMYVWIDEITSSKVINHATIMAVNTSNGTTYAQGVYADRLNGWRRLDGQVPKITDDSGNVKYNISDVNKPPVEIFNEFGSGLHTVYLMDSKGQPEPYIMGTVTQMKYSSTIEGEFVGTALGSGNTYSYSYNNSGTKGWSKLSGQGFKITPDNATFTTLNDKTRTAMDMLSSTRRDYQAINMIDSKGQPEQHLIGKVQSTPDGKSGIFIGTSSLTGKTYSYGYNSGRESGWVDLQGQLYKITSDDGTEKYKISDTSQVAYELFKLYGSGMFTVSLTNSKNQPEPYIIGTVVQSRYSTGECDGQFIGVSLGSGTAYSYSYSTGGVKGWRRLSQNVTNLLNQEAYYGVDGILLDKLTNYEFVDVTAILSGNSVTTRYKVSSDVGFEIPLTNVYNDTSSTGFEIFEIQGSINDTRVTVSRSKGVKVGNTTTTSNNTSEIKIVGVYGVNKIK